MKYGQPNERPRMKSTKEERKAVDPESRRENGEMLIPRVPKVHLKGRPLKYTPAKFRNRINDYFATCDKASLVPSVSGIYRHLKIDKMSWYAYCDRPQFQAICSWAKDCIEQWYTQGLWETNSSNTNKQLVAKQICGWQDQVTHTTRIISAEEATAKLERFLPILLELQKQAMIEQKTIIEGEVIDGRS
jgi:hypothetical protein